MGGHDGYGSGFDEYSNKLTPNPNKICWYVREYVRQALANGELDTKSAIVKISNTALAQQLGQIRQLV